jgi:hypothetical protein
VGIKDARKVADNSVPTWIAAVSSSVTAAAAAWTAHAASKSASKKTDADW